MVLLDTQSPTGTGVVTFSSISSAYRHLRVTAVIRGTNVSTSITIAITLNNDTGANYDRQNFQGSNASASASVSTGQTALVSLSQPAASATSNFAGAIDLMVYDYKGTTFQKICEATNLYRDQSAGAGMAIQKLMAAWRSTSAVNRIDLTCSAGNYAAGTVISLYGIL
jgi:hypothetical protein